MSNAVHQELMETDSDYVTGVAETQARREAELLEKLNQGADQMRQLREKQQQQFQQSAGTAETGPHNRDFLRRMGTADLRNIPARRLIK